MMGAAATIQRAEPGMSYQEAVGLARMIVKGGHRLERMLEGGDQLPDDHWKTLFDQYADAGAGR